MVVKVTTQVVDNRQDPFPATAEFVYWKMKGGDHYYVLGSDHREANAVAKVQWELQRRNPSDNPAYLEFVTDWEVLNLGHPMIAPTEAWETGKVFTIEGTAVDQVDYLTANTYGTSA
jgi:hypothetical protein